MLKSAVCPEFKTYFGGAALHSHLLQWTGQSQRSVEFESKLAPARPLNGQR